MSETYINTTDRVVYWIAYGDGDPAYGELQPGSQVSTGKPHLEIFTGFLACRARLAELGTET